MGQVWWVLWSNRDYELQESELANYLEKPGQKASPKLNEYTSLEWWKSNRITYLVLFEMAADISAVPMTIVASKATFSVGTQVTGSYQALLHPDAIQMLYWEDWCRNLHGNKKKIESKLYCFTIEHIGCFFSNYNYSSWLLFSFFFTEHAAC